LSNMAINKLQKLEDQLWNAADGLRTNSELSSNEYSTPVLGLIFLKYADYKLEALADKLGRKNPDKLDVQAEGVLYLPEEARFKTLLNLPEGTSIGQAINNAMKAIEQENEDLRGILPKSYTTIDNQILVDLLKNFNSIDFAEGDVFGKIYEYFLAKFALAEGQGGGEFFTPTSIVKLIVEVIEPFQGKIFDPACGSGGMFVQSANFVQAHHKSANTAISVYGQEKTAATVRLGKMNLAVHGIYGDIRQGNSYYDDIHNSVGKFDFVMANPPFNANGIDKDRIKNDPRFPLGMPATDNGNYIWIESFYSALNNTGRAGFVMANSASDARNSELEIRKKLIKEKVVDVMIAVGPNMFYTVTLPCQLWFLDKGKKNTDRADKVLFLDVRHIFSQIDRAHREFSPAQIEFIANIVNLYRGEVPEFKHGSEDIFAEHGIVTNKYENFLGLCKVATIDEIEAQDWTLNPGRYVGVKEGEIEDLDFVAEFEKLTEDIGLLNAEAHELEELIEANSREVLDGSAQ
jgi:type I restriction enzyme M protein